jgi:hypothetical protein
MGHPQVPTGEMKGLDRKPKPPMEGREEKKRRKRRKKRRKED